MNTGSANTGSGKSNSEIKRQSAFDFGEQISAFKKNAKRVWYLFLILPLVCGLVSCWNAGRKYTPKYTAYASFIVNVTNSNYSSSYYNRATASQLALTFPYIINSGVLNNIIAEDLNMSYVPAVLSVSVEGSTNILTMKATDSNPDNAYKVLNSAIENYPQVAEYVVGSTALTILDESGVPAAPSNSLSYKRPAVKGILAGIAAAMVIAGFITFTRKTVIGTDSLRKLVNMKFLGSVPLIKLKKRSKLNESQILCEKFKRGEISADVANSVRLITNRVEKYSSDHNAHIFVMTSTVPGEGKSSCAVQLAQALAEHRNSVAIVDCDLRRPTIQRFYKFADNIDSKSCDTTTGERKYGLTDLLNGDVTKPNQIVYQENGVYVIPSFSPIKGNHAADVISSKKLSDIIELLGKQMDYVILDTPPVGTISDAESIAASCDAMIMVVRQDVAKRGQILYAIRRLEGTGKPFAGCILNAAEASSSSYYGYYGHYNKYGYYSRYGKYGRYSRYGSSYKSYSSYNNRSSGYVTGDPDTEDDTDTKTE